MFVALAVAIACSGSEFLASHFYARTRPSKNSSATVRPVYMRAAAVIRVSLGIWIPTARIESSAPRSTRIWTLSGSTVTCRPTTARISSRSTAMRSVWPTRLRSYSSRMSIGS